LLSNKVDKRYVYRPINIVPRHNFQLSSLRRLGVYYVSKNVPPLTCYNLDTHGSITINFWLKCYREVAIKMYFIFPPHLTSASALHGETGNPEIASFHLNACFTKTHETLKYHQVTAEPPFTVKKIDWVHQTGPMNGA